MDRLVLKGIVGYGYHGVLPEERRLGQRFKADVELLADLSAVGATDSLHGGIDYGEVYDLVLAILEGKPVRTLERLATLVNEQVLAHFAVVQEVRTRVYKPSAPVRGPLDYVMVERALVRK